VSTAVNTLLRICHRDVHFIIPNSPIQWVPGDLYMVVKRSGREADHSHLSSAEVEE